MEVLKYYHSLIESKIYSEWLHDHKNSYLFMVFSLIEENINNFDFIFLEDGISTTFSIGDKIGFKSDEYKDRHPEELIFDNLKVGMKDALSLANEHLLKYGKHPIKKMVILEVKNKILQWNISLFLQSFNTFNIKINATSKDIIEQTFQPLFSWDK